MEIILQLNANPINGSKSSGIENTLNPIFTMEPNTLANNWVAQYNPISLVAKNRPEEIRVRPDPIGMSWYLFVPLLTMTGGLLVPQVRDYFFYAGWRWVHVMLLSFGISLFFNDGEKTPIANKIMILRDAIIIHFLMLPLL